MASPPSVKLDRSSLQNATIDSLLRLARFLGLPTPPHHRHEQGEPLGGCARCKDHLLWAISDTSLGAQPA